MKASIVPRLVSLVLSTKKANLKVPDFNNPCAFISLSNLRAENTSLQSINQPEWLTSRHGIAQKRILQRLEIQRQTNSMQTQKRRITCKSEARELEAAAVFIEAGELVTPGDR